MPADSVPFLAPGIAWALVVLFSVLWVALGCSVDGSERADDYMLVAATSVYSSTTVVASGHWQHHAAGPHPPKNWALGMPAMLCRLASLACALASRIKQLMLYRRTSGDFIRLRYGRLAWWCSW